MKLLPLLLCTLVLAGCAHPVIVTAPPVVIAPAPQQTQSQIPPGHYPPPGSCRIWIPGVPPGQQSPPGNCTDLQRRVPPGAVLVGR
jgi:hypothetical protein